MKIFKENGKIRIQLMQKTPIQKMLFDFTIEIEEFESLKNHIIKHLQYYRVEDSKFD